MVGRRRPGEETFGCWRGEAEVGVREEERMDPE